MSYAKYSALVCPMVTFLIVLIGTIVNRPLFTLFGLGETALQYGKYMMLIYLFFGTVRTCNYIMNESFRAGGEAVFGTVVEIICLYAISVPATWLAGMIWNLPFLLVFSFVYTDEIIRLVILGRYMIQGKWIKPVTSQGKAALEDFWIVVTVQYLHSYDAKSIPNRLRRWDFALLNHFLTVSAVNASTYSE